MKCAPSGTFSTVAHAKNYSLMISGRGFSLAPIYDVMCASVFDGVTQNLVQKIAGKNRGDHLQRSHWEAFAADCGLSPKRLVQRVETLARLVLKELPTAEAAVAAMPAGGHPLLPECVRDIKARAVAVSEGLAQGAAVQKQQRAASSRRQI